MRQQPGVLIVEDEPAIAELIAVNLRHNGFRPTWAMDSASAQRELDAVLPDVILLDWMLPGSPALTPAPMTTSPSRFPPRSCWPACVPCCADGPPNKSVA